jgi:hypothetical protein
MPGKPHFIRAVLLTLLGALLLGLVRYFLPERPVDATGIRALLDAVFALGLLAFLLLLAAGTGLRLLRWLRLEGPGSLERALFAVPLGLGVLAYGVLALGLVGLLRPWAILLWLLLVAALTWREWGGVVAGLRAWLSRQPRAWAGLSAMRKAMLLLAGAILFLALLQALSPPNDYDGLMYHLQGPRLFLERGRLFLLPDLWQANGPFTVEMLFTVGLAFGSDTFARLLHLAYAVLLILAVFAAGRRYLGERGGWLAAGVLLGVPVLPLWASTTYVDTAWALMEFLALLALDGAVLPVGENGAAKSAPIPKCTLLAGLLAGLALGMRLLALGGVAALVLVLLWRGRACGWRPALRQALLFSGVGLLAALPWYLKNLLWAGNPFYPLFFGGPEWPPFRLTWLMTYLQSFGVGRSPLDFLLLPWNLYAHHDRFATFFWSTEAPSLIFPLAIFYLLTRRRDHRLDGVALFALLRFAVWAVGSQQTRFLLPTFPALSLLVAHVLLRLADLPALPRVGRMVSIALVAGTVCTTLFYAFASAAQTGPLSVVVGAESKEAFLRRTVHDYAAMRFIQEELPPTARVMMLWDGQGYYCDARCLPDADQSRWVQLVGSDPDPAEVASRLRESGVTHLLFSDGDAAFIISQHDPTGQHRAAAAFLLRDFLPAHARQVYADERVHVYELR